MKPVIDASLTSTARITKSMKVITATKISGSVVGDFTDLFEVFRHPADGRPVFWLSKRTKVLQVIETLAAHLGFDVDAEHISQ